MTTWTTIESPIGPLTLIGGPAGLRHLRFPGATPPPAADRDDGPGPLREAAEQLIAYFAGERTAFDCALDLHGSGTPLQREVWTRLSGIPFGERTTYGALARSLGRPAAVRAVAAAVGRTPIPVVIPCHRVVGGDGGLTGYLGGLERKAWLLAHEAAAVPPAGIEPALRA